MHKLVVIGFIILSSNIFSQDTINLVTTERLLVRVLEISPTQVRYKNYYNPDGIIRFLTYDEIESITYENGKKEERFVSAQKKSKSELPYFKIEDDHISIKDQDITHKEALKMMMKKDTQTNSDELNESLVICESKKNGQIGFSILAPVCVIGGFIIAKRNYYGPNDRQKFQNILLTGISLGACSFIVAQVYKSIKNKNVRKAAKLYNQEILSN